jgi:hypothetical protein
MTTPQNKQPPSGLAGMALCQGLIAAAKRWRPIAGARSLADAGCSARMIMANHRPPQVAE